jgi:hypothetical protein
MTSDICITECIRSNPFGVHRYTWEDKNYRGFNEFITPMAEDIDDTFRLSADMGESEHRGIFSVDGIALGLAMENLKRIDALESELKELKNGITR